MSNNNQKEPGQVRAVVGRLDHMFVKARGSMNLWECSNCSHKEWRFPEIIVASCLLCEGKPWPPNPQDHRPPSPAPLHHVVGCEPSNGEKQ
jgi:hypothetical protein